MGPAPATLEEIYAKMLANSVMIPETDCLEWQGATNNGYCHFRWKGSRHYLHRFIYSLFVGPEREVIRHSCDNSRCWNPAHLIGGTHQENMQDMVDRGRQAYGTKHGRIILTPEQVQEIRSSILTNKQLAEKYRVGKTTIQHVQSGRNWRCLQW